MIINNQDFYFMLCRAHCLVLSDAAEHCFSPPSMYRYAAIKNNPGAKVKQDEVSAGAIWHFTLGFGISLEFGF